jgi:hypothetical protein
MSWADPESTWVLDHDGRGAPAIFHHPISDIEPVEPPANQIRGAHVRAITLINQFGAIMQEALEGPRASVDHARTRLYAIGFALGCNFCGNTTLTDKARELNVTKAVLSRHATAFLDATGLEPSFYLKSAESHKVYAVRRRQSVAQNGNGSNGNGTHPA